MIHKIAKTIKYHLSKNEIPLNNDFMIKVFMNITLTVHLKYTDLTKRLLLGTNELLNIKDFLIYLLLLTQKGVD